ncbi:MAG: HPr(Ser) kinase/phosphatase [Clostridia bacterium]
MYSVMLIEVIEEFQLEIVCECKNLDKVKITTSDINRPGLQVTGYLEYFGTDRIQIIGKVETSFLSELSSEERRRRLDEFFKTGFPCMVVARGLEVFPEMIEVAKKYNIPVLRTNDTTSGFLGGLLRFLNVELAPRMTKHGVFVEVYGEGILLIGDSGVGKSETALELVKRGHRLVADDVVEIRKVSDKTLIGTAPEVIRHFIEIRGIGILDVKNLYGVGSVKIIENIDLVINLEFWDNNKNYHRLGLVEQFTEILGINVPSLSIPVRPGRNLAIIAEVAALNSRQKKMGYNAAETISERVLGEMHSQDNNK